MTGPSDAQPAVRWLVVVSIAVQTLQLLATDYGTGSRGAGVVWFVIGVALVVLVLLRRSRAARTVFVVVSVLSGLVYLSAAVHDPSQALTGIAFVAQAVPLVLPPVNRHVRAAAPAQP